MAPSSFSSQHQSEPLLPPKLMNEQHAEPISSTSSGAIKTLSILRVGIGLACLAAPRWTCAMFQFPVPADMAVLTRLFGGRDLVLGELLWTAEDRTSAEGGRREIKRALWAGIGADAIDLCSAAFGLATGTMKGLPAGLFAGGAVAGMALGALGLRGV